MAIRFDSPVFTAFDANGNPLPGALLNFYEAGTTTRLDTFSDEGLTTANANPVVADAAGRFGNIWLKEQDYKVVLTTAAGVTVWTRDPVQGALAVEGDDFKVSEQSPADMTVQVAAGTLYDLVGKSRVSKAAQTSATITAPTTNPRRDIVHINRLTGVIGITTGAEAASPSDPTLAAGLLPLARISLATSTTEITSSEITDIRELANIGAADAVEYDVLDEDDMASDSASAVPTQQSAKAYVDFRAGLIGEVKMYAGAAANIPSGWLPCDGSAISRTTYADLFAEIGTLWGVGDGSTTFNIPDFRGKSPLGVNDAGLPNGVDGSFTTRNEADTGGEEAHQLTIAEMPAHTHTMEVSEASSGVTGSTASTPSPANTNTGSTGGDTAHNTMHPFAAINFIIYAGS